MDFHSMKRRELQALCKKHRIPANLSNHEMANRLTEFLKENQEPFAEGGQKGQDGNASEAEIIDVVVNRKGKTVRFSPEHELIEFTRSRDLKRRSKRNSASIRSSSVSVENASNGEINNEDIGRLGRVTRSRGLKLMEGKENEKKRGRYGDKGHDQKNDVASVENFVNHELESGVNSPRKVRGKVVVGTAINESKRERKRTKNDNRRDKNALDNAADDNLMEEMLDVPGRLTRARGQKLMGDALKKEGRGRNVVQSNGNACLVSAEIGDDKGLVSRNVRRGKSNSTVGEEVLEKQKIAEVHVMAEPPIMLRRSRRTVNRIGGSEVLSDDTKENESCGIKIMKETPKLAADGSGMDAKGIDLNASVAVQVEEHNKLDRRRSNRRRKGEKNGIKSQEDTRGSELQSESEHRYPMRHSRLQLRTAREASNDGDLKVPQPTEVIRRSRHDSLSLETISEEEKLNIGATAETVEIKKHSNKQCPAEEEIPIFQKNTRRSTRNASKHKSSEILHKLDEDCILQPGNGTRKRRKGSISEDVITNNDPNMLTQSMNKENKRKKAAAPAMVDVVVVDKMKQPSMLDACAMSQQGLLTRESGQLVLPEGTISENVSLSDTSPSADNLLLHDQADFKTDLNATEVEEGKYAQPRLHVLDNNHEDVSVPKNLESVETVHAKVTGSSVNCQHNDADPLDTSYCCYEGDNDDTVLKAGEAIAFEFCERHNVYPKSALQPKEPSNKLRVIREDDNTAEGHEADKGRCGQDCEDASIEDNAFCVSDLFEGDRSTSIIPQDTGIFEAEYSTANIDEETVHDDSLAEAPTIIYADSTEVNLDRGHEDHIVKTDETCIDTSMHSESVKTDQGGSFQDHGNDCSEEDGEFMSHLFDDERIATTTSPDGGIISAKCAMKGSDKQGSSGLPEIIPSRQKNASEFQVGAGVGETARRKANGTCHSNIAAEEMPMAKTINNGECQVANQADDHGNEDTHESAQPNSELVNPTAVDDTVHEQETWSSALENGYTTSISKTNSEGKSRQVVRVSDTDNDANDVNWEDNMEDPVSACAADLTISISIPEVGFKTHSKWECEKMGETENECKDLLTKHTLSDAGEENSDTESSQSWTELDLNNMFETTEEDFTSTRLDHTPSRGTKMANLTTCVKRPTVGSTKKKKEMEGEQGNESVKTTNAGCSAGMEENQLKLLFATPCTVDDTSTNDRKLDRTAMSLKESPESIMGSMLTQMMCNEEMQDTRHESGSSLCLENPSFNNIEVVTYAELKEVESVELVNACVTKVPSEAECKVCEASEEQVTNNACECSEETGLKEVESAELVYKAKDSSEAQYKVCEASKEQLIENTYKCREENLCTTEVPRETEYGVTAEVEYISPKVSEEQLAENTCEFREATELSEVESVELVNARVSEVAQEDEFNVCEASEEQLSDNINEGREKNTCAAEVRSEAEYYIFEVSEELLTENTWEYGDETKAKEVESVELENTCTTRVPRETEYEVCEASEEQLTENTCASREENVFTTEVQYNAHGASEEPLVENTCECREETELNEVESMELVNYCATEVLREAEFSVCEASAEQFTENGNEHKEETECNEVGSVEMISTCATEVNQDIESNVCESSEEQFTDKEHECREEIRIDEVDNVDSVNAYASEVPIEAEYNVCEVSEEQLTENTCEGREEADSTAQNMDEKIFHQGQCSQYEEATDYDNASRERIITDSSEYLDEAEVSTDMLMDTEYFKIFCYGNSINAKSSSNEAALELSDADFQKSNVPGNSHQFSSGYADGNLIREASINDFSHPVEAGAILFSCTGEEDFIDEGNLTSSLSRASDDSDKGTGKGAQLSKDGDSYGANILDGADDNPRSSHDFTDELHTSDEVAINNEITYHYTRGMEADKATSILELHSISEETQEGGIITQNALVTAPAAGHDFDVCVVQSDDTLSSLAMHLHFGNNENGGVSTDAGISFFNAEADQETNAKDINEISSPTVQSVSNVPASKCNEILKESDVADAIQEYINSESSLAADLDETSPRLRIDALRHTQESTSQNAATVESQGDTNGIHPNSDPHIIKPSVETACQEPEESELPPPEPAAHINLLEEGSAGDARSEMEPEVSHRHTPKLLHSTAKKNARTILIHGTPRKQLTAVDMKENAPSHKTSSITDFTTVRPKRKALQDVKR